MSGAPAVILNNAEQGAHSATYAQVLHDTRKGALIYPEKSAMPVVGRPVSDSDSDVDSLQSGTDQSDMVRLDVDDDGGGGRDSNSGGEEEVEDGEGASVDSDEDAEEDDEYPTIVWTGYGKKVPIVVFKADAIVSKKAEFKNIGEKYHLQFKFVKTDCKVLRTLLTAHGFSEAHPNSNDFNLMWTGSHLKPYVLRSMLEFQKVNHFPRSYEITRKDRLFKNVQRMQQTKGFKHFDFVPMSFIVPGEFQDFCSTFLKDKGPWIVKPIASSRGRGIFLVNHPEQVPLDDTLIVSKYIPNPLLIDGFKFDVRLYIGVTSYDPLIIYMYEEGLTRFATVKYEKNVKNIRNTCMHLTNYSVNKKSQDYVKNDDPDIEDFGNKWSLGALLRYLRSQGKDTTAMMMRVEDVIIKTILSAELPIATACKMFMPFKGNCFEVYGFDILIDENLRPWVLEVNLSPSLACDAPIDLKIKSNMLADLFSLVGFVCHDPMMRKIHQGRRNAEMNGRASRPPSRPTSSASIRPEAKWRPKNRPGSAGSNKATRAPSVAATNRGQGGLNSEEIKMSRKAKEENQRRGGWVRIFPSPDSWELYSSFMQYTTTNNLMLWQQLFPERAKNTLSLKPTTAAYSSTLARAKSVHLHSAQYPQLYISTQQYLYAKQMKDDALAQALQRSLQYERKLSALGDRRKRRVTQEKRAIKKGAPNIATNFKGSLVQGVPEDTMSGPKPVRESSENTKDTKEDRVQKESKTEVTGKPPIKKADSKQSLQSNSHAGNSSSGTKGLSKDESSSSKKEESSLKGKHQQQESGSGSTKSKSENSNKSKQLASRSSESIKTDSGRVTGKSSAENSSKKGGGSTTGGSSSNKTSGGGDVNSGNTLSKPPTGNKVQSEKVQVKACDASPSLQQQQGNFQYNVVELLEKGKTMTKVQARHAFATYLTRVQQRLLAESIHTEVDDIDQANEQMDLVLRFLKRAAGNLQQPFRVVVPSRKLPLNDRRRILAKQLGEFVHIYNKETEQLRHRNMIDKKCLRRGNNQNTLEEDKFNKFVHTASESELEEVLTTYTKLNKSASIFLGGNSKSTGDKPPPVVHTEASLPRRREQAGEHSDQHDRMLGGYSSGSLTDLNSDAPSSAGGMGSNSSLNRTPSQSSYQNAVMIYSTKLSSQNGLLRQRPSSASSQRSIASSKASSVRTRPASASTSWQAEGGETRPVNHQPMGEREGPDGAETVQNQVHEEAINSALQRIALRQQQRHYVANKGSNVLALSSAETTPRLPQDQAADMTNGNMSGASGNGGAVSSHSKPPPNGRAVQTNVDFYPMKGGELVDGGGSSGNGGLTSSSETAIRVNGPYNGSRRSSSTQQNSSRSVKSVRSANDTFQQFVDDSDHSSDRVSAYSQVTGVSPINRNYTPSFQSTQYQIAQHQMMVKQQRMIEQSKVLLEQSKAKHQAMIAQAHAASQKGLPNGVAVEDPEAAFTPKPPANPNSEKKTVGAHRMARSQVLEDGFTTSQFYNSLKYDTYTGSTAKPKVVYSSAYNTGL